MDSVSGRSSRKEEILSSSSDFNANDLIEPDEATATESVLKGASISGDAIWPPGPKPGGNTEEEVLWSRNEALLDTLEEASHFAIQIAAPTVSTTWIVNRADELNHGGIYWANRYEVSGKVEDIDNAIKYFSRAVVLIPDGHAGRPGRLNNLGNSHASRFEHLADLADIDRAIACQSQAVLLTPDGCAEKPRMLSNLSTSHKSRFEHLGDLADIDRAITCQSQAMLLTPDGHADRPGRLNNLGNSHAMRFKHLGDLADIDRAITCQSQAVLLTPDGHADRPGRLSNLGNSHTSRFEHLEDLADIDRAIACQSQAVLLTPDSHADKPDMLSNLGTSHQSRFEHLGDLVDIDSAITYQSRAVLLTPDGHADRPGRLNNLGILHQSRFQHLGDLADVDSAVACESQAVLLAPDGHADKPGTLNNLGISHQSRFEHLGDLADIDRAIACQSQAVLLTPDDHAYKPRTLSNLGTSLRCRFEHLGDLADINRAIVCQSRAVLLTPDGHADRPARLDPLGASLRCRFEHLADLADIDRAIACQSQVVLLTPDGHADRPVRLSNLGGSLFCRFEHLGDLADIDRAIACQSQAMLLTPDSHAEKPGILSNLGTSHQGRFEHLGDLADMDSAVAYKSRAVLLTPDGHADKPGRLSNLGNSHQSRSRHLGNLADIDSAIACQSQAMLLTPDGHADRPGWLNNLGNSHAMRFEYLGDLADIDRAITYQSQAVLLTPDGHADRPVKLNNLGTSHLSRFLHLVDVVDIDRALVSLRMAAHCSTGITRTLFKASRLWASLSVDFDPSTALSAYQWTMGMVPKVVWIGSTVNHRYEDIHSIGDLAVEAAAVAISAQEYGLALEWLEAGRSIVWNQTLQLRSQFDDLFIVDSDLAASLRTAAIALERAGSKTSDPPSLVDSYTLEAVAQGHRRLAEDFEGLLTRARQIPGFEALMRSKKIAELMPAAQSGAVVVVNVHKAQCDALILRPHTEEITHVPLPNVSQTKLVDLQCQMQEFTTRGATQRRPEFHLEQLEEIESVLHTLWQNIVKPILTSLGYVKKLSVDQLPHITWCMTGVLTMLPIHAAGCYDETGDNLFSYAISSYAPTLSSLISSKPGSFELGGVLAVSQEATLPGTNQELALIKQHTGKLPHLQLTGHEATAEAVLDAMESFSSVHFACHASQNLSQPLKSCFHLHDRGLSLADITKRSLENKGLAFLSACQTATGDTKSPDEAIHLAAGMLIAGYPTVIATMWSIVDSDAPLVADIVYSQLAKDGKLSGGRVARALHAAVTALRDRIGEKEFVRWVPYIHMGV